MTLSPDFHLPIRRRLRGSLFLSLGISSAVPILHLRFLGEYVNGFEKVPKLQYWYIGGITYVLGGFIFILRIPEKYFIGKFDYVGSSHQILHFFVIIGFLFHYLGGIDSYYYRVENQCPLV